MGEQQKVNFFLRPASPLPHIPSYIKRFFPPAPLRGRKILSVFQLNLEKRYLLSNSNIPALSGVGLALHYYPTLHLGWERGAGILRAAARFARKEMVLDIFS